VVLIIDNYDSFTYNLYQQIAGLGHETIVVTHDSVTLSDIASLNPSHIVISPGPKRPADSGISQDVIRHFYKTKPILGVCLGHQCIGEIFGSHTVAAPTVMHGKSDLIYHTQTDLFEGVPNPFTGARYHSLVVDQVPNEFVKLAWSKDGSIMAMRHAHYPVYGVQFHPESFLSEHGERIMEQFLTC